ncbi:MAG TPA: rod shape-determining protein MreC, partial [Lentisphaeria bacterium]|nr:rod shape-determining protein MreC [Lentisphaeria bacterium]
RTLPNFPAYRHSFYFRFFRMIRNTFRHFLFVVVSLAIVLLLVLGSSGAGRRLALGAATPFIYAWRGVERGAAAVIGWLMPGEDPRTRELLEARTALRLAQIDVAATEDLRRENSELRALLALPGLPEWRVVAAPVLTRDPASWNLGFTIGRGAADGVTVGAVVMSGAAVLGRVSRLHERSAEVVTIASPACRFSVVVAGTSATGVLSGLGAFSTRSTPLCQVDFLPRDLQVMPGRQIVTSGLGGWMPGGLPIGSVIVGDNGDTTTILDNARARLTVAPLADFSTTRFVAIICPLPQAPQPQIIE